MGVDLETYRGRIGTFRTGSGVDVLILHCIIQFSLCLKYIGSVVFIGILLLIEGVEQNPGPTDKGFTASKTKSHRDLDNRLYKNWIRAVTGLKYLKFGLETFIDGQIKRQHHDLLHSYVKGTGREAKQCSECTSENLMPEHPTRRCIQRYWRRCFCSDHLSRRKCPNEFCSRFYDLIVNAHAEANPLWLNTDPARWYNDYFEFAKCFLGSTTYTDIHSASDIDASGLLTIAINDFFVHDAVDCLDNFKKCRLVRNEIVHTTSFEVTESELAGYIDQMIAVLEDKRHLYECQQAREAIEKLEQLKNDQIHISFEDADEMYKQSLAAALSEMTETSKKEIEQMKQESINDFNQYYAEKQDDLATFHEASKSELLKEVENEIVGRTHLVFESLSNFSGQKQLELSRQISADVQRKKADMVEEIDMYFQDKHSDTTSSIDTAMLKAIARIEEKRVADLDKDIKDMRNFLIETYSQFYLKIDVSPLLPGNEVHIDQVYVPLALTIFDENAIQTVHLLHDVFCSDGKLLKNIFVTADAGMGKTTLCKKLVSLWCQAYQMPSSQITDKNIDNMRDFSFVFVVSLRDINDEVFVEDMVKNQLLNKNQHALFDDIIQSNDHKCLVILDGLDEWSPKENAPSSSFVSEGLPLKQYKLVYTSLYTTRPWKLETIRPRQSEIDREVRIMGLRNSSYLITNYANIMKERDIEKLALSLIEEIEMKKLHMCKNNPLLLRLLICLITEKRSLPETQFYVYCSIIELLLLYAPERNKKDREFKTLFLALSSSDTTLPDCFQEYGNCNRCASLLLVVGKLAYESIFVKTNTNHSPKLVFRENELKKEFFITEQELDLLFKIGIFSQRDFSSLIHRQRRLSFLHTSFHEYFAALYISNNDSLFATVTARCRSLVDVIGMSKILQFVFAMKPHLIFDWFLLVESFIDVIQLSALNILSEERIMERITFMLMENMFDCARSFETRPVFVCKYLWISGETAKAISECLSVTEIQSSYIVLRNSAVLKNNNKLNALFKDIMEINEGNINCLKLVFTDTTNFIRFKQKYPSLNCLALYWVHLTRAQFQDVLILPSLSELDLHEVEFDDVPEGNVQFDVFNDKCVYKIKVLKLSSMSIIRWKLFYLPHLKDIILREVLLSFQQATVFLNSPELNAVNLYSVSCVELSQSSVNESQKTDREDGDLPNRISQADEEVKFDSSNIELVCAERTDMTNLNLFHVQFTNLNTLTLKNVDLTFRQVANILFLSQFHFESIVIDDNDCGKFRTSIKTKFKGTVDQIERNKMCIEMIIFIAIDLNDLGVFQCELLSLHSLHLENVKLSYIQFERLCNSSQCKCMSEIAVQERVSCLQFVTLRHIEITCSQIINIFLLPQLKTLHLDSLKCVECEQLICTTSDENIQMKTEVLILEHMTLKVFPATVPCLQSLKLNDVDLTLTQLSTCLIPASLKQVTLSCVRFVCGSCFKLCNMKKSGERQDKTEKHAIRFENLLDMELIHFNLHICEFLYEVSPMHLQSLTLDVSLTHKQLTCLLTSPRLRHVHLQNVECVCCKESDLNQTEENSDETTVEKLEQLSARVEMLHIDCNSRDKMLYCNIFLTLKMCVLQELVLDGVDQVCFPHLFDDLFKIIPTCQRLRKLTLKSINLEEKIFEFDTIMTELIQVELADVSTTQDVICFLFESLSKLKQRIEITVSRIRLKSGSIATVYNTLTNSRNYHIWDSRGSFFINKQPPFSFNMFKRNKK